MTLRITMGLALWLALLSGAVQGAGLSSREWELDRQIIIADVLGALTERFNERGAGSSAEFGIAVLAQLKAVREKIHDDSYHIMRNTVLTMSEDFAKLTEEAPEDTSHFIHRWQAADGYIRTKINYVGDLLTITGR